MRGVSLLFLSVVLQQIIVARCIRYDDYNPKVPGSKAKKEVPCEEKDTVPQKTKVLSRVFTALSNLVEDEIKPFKDNLREDINRVEQEFLKNTGGKDGLTKLLSKEIRSNIEPEIEGLIYTLFLSDKSIITVYKTCMQISSIVGSARGKKLMKDLGISDAMKSRFEAELSHLPPKTLESMEMAIDVTAELAADALDLARKENVPIAEILDQFCLLAKELQVSLNSTSSIKAVRLFCPKQHYSAAKKIIETGSIPVIQLVTMSALLNGFDPREEPLINGIIIAFSLGECTREFSLGLISGKEKSDGKGQAGKIEGKETKAGGSVFDNITFDDYKEIALRSFVFFAELRQSIDSGDNRRTSKSEFTKERMYEILDEYSDAYDSVIIKRKNPLPTQTKIALTFARLMRYRASKKHAPKKSEYMWGGMYKMAAEDNDNSVLAIGKQAFKENGVDFDMSDYDNMESEEEESEDWEHANKNIDVGGMGEIGFVVDEFSEEL